MGQESIWLWYPDGSIWVKAQCDADGKLVISDADPFTIEQASPQSLKHVPHGYFAFMNQYLPFAVDADGKQLIVNTLLGHHATHEDGDADEISIEGLDGAPAQKAQASGLASLNASTKVVEQPASITDHLEDTPSNGETTKAPTSNWAYDHENNKSAHQSNTIGIVFIIDGGGSAITTGQKGHLEIPFACTITGWTILANQSGSIVVDVWKDTYANFPPTAADTIAGSEKPTLSSAQKNQDLTLTTWTTAVTAGDILAFNVDSVSTVTRVTIVLRATKT